MTTSGGTPSGLSAILIGVGLLFALRRSDSRVLLVGLGALTHLIFDPVATDARTLFWPLFGSTFQHPRGYWFESPVPGPVIDVMLITALLTLPQAFEPFSAPDLRVRDVGDGIASAGLTRNSFLLPGAR